MGRFKAGEHSSPQTEFKPGHQYRWLPGESGNPVGKSKLRAQFEQAFFDALMGEGSPEEAARLLWECARAKEPWAIQTLLQRIAPIPTKIELSREVNDDEGQRFDYDKLTDAELSQLEKLLERAAVATPQLEAGASQQESR